MKEVAKVLAFRVPEETRSPEEARGQEAEGDSDLKEPREPDSAEAVDLDAASTGMVMLLRLTLDAMKSSPTRAQTLPASTVTRTSVSTIKGGS